MTDSMRDPGAEAKSPRRIRTEWAVWRKTPYGGVLVAIAYTRDDARHQAARDPDWYVVRREVSPWVAA